MGRDPRPAPDGVAKFDRLAQDAERFHLLHALRVLEAHFEDTGRLGETRRPREDRVRLGQVPELAFPRATIAAFKPGTAGRPARLTNRFFGLWGPHGPLPLHLTDYARARSRNHRDPTLVAFADLFTHRMLSLFYRAWTSGEPAPSFDRPGQDPFAASVAALTGLRGAPFAERDAMPDLAKRFFAGHLANGPKHAAGLVAMLRGFFGASVRLQPFEGSWLTLEPSDRWRLGRPGRLGRDLNLGRDVWSRTAKFSLRIGPLTAAEYARLLPGAPGLDRLRAIVRNYVGDAMDYDVVLVLKADAVPETRLGRGARLGLTTWIGQRPPGRDADDLQLAA